MGDVVSVANTIHGRHLALQHGGPGVAARHCLPQGQKRALGTSTRRVGGRRVWWATGGAGRPQHLTGKLPHVWGKQRPPCCRVLAGNASPAKVRERVAREGDDIKDL